MIYEECLIAHHPTSSTVKRTDLPPSQKLLWIDPSFKGIRNKQKWINHIPDIPNPTIRSHALYRNYTQRHQNAALMVACRQIHAEAAPLLYGKNIFELSVQRRPTKIPLDKAGIYPRYTPLIRQLHVRFDLEWKDYAQFITKDVQDLMAAVNKDILPFCSNLAEIRWSISSFACNLFEAEFWTTWEPLWRHNRDRNHETRVALFNDYLDGLKPGLAPILPILHLDLYVDRDRAYPIAQFWMRWHASAPSPADRDTSRLIQIEADIEGLKSDFREAFRRMKQRHVQDLITNSTAGMVSHFLHQSYLSLTSSSDSQPSASATSEVSNTKTEK